MKAPSPDSIESMVDRGIPVAQSTIISLAKLRAKDSSELVLLDKVASTTGLFYLDLRGDIEGECVLGHLPDVYAVVEKYFNQPEDAKAKDARFDIKASQDLGYKRGYGCESFEVDSFKITSRIVIVHY